ncbi:glycoside hydrolase family protein [Hymenobacter rubripertinctus]|uniref:Uncharacterized protein n=1 Tax=Hymenobacter rubripertinctus TaxID=2029981 RepID=A0A418QNL6_9BACT|nr:hypothetical protein [Hymenobacter rubripertinctus]RIY06678.1 hypothetical protein D0T11_18175 [Hymenobacter rubripertinctus]
MLVPPHTPDTLAQSWQAVHERLVSAGVPDSLSDLSGFSMYHYCAYQVLNQPQDRRLAQQLYQQLRAALSQLPPPQLLHHLDALCAAAWLAPRLDPELAETADPGLWARLDAALYQPAEQICSHPEAARRHTFFCILRYFSLRLPAAKTVLHALLALGLPPLLAAAPTQPVPLGLDGGLAAELLVLLRLHRQGVAVPELAPYVRAGLLLLLGMKQRVDFEAGHCSVFPYQLHSQSGEATYSAELSWHRGDLGQALLLYESHSLLPDPELAKIAELVGLNTLLRTSQATTELVSAAWHRGAAGVAHLYRQLHHISRHPAYRTGYHYWLGQTQHWLPAALAADSTISLADLTKVGLVLLEAQSEDGLGWDVLVL